jgi:hypothetical protein
MTLQERHPQERHAEIKPPRISLMARVLTALAGLLAPDFSTPGVSGEDQPALERRDPALSIDFLRETGLMWARDTPLDDPGVSPLFGIKKGFRP